MPGRRHGRNQGVFDFQGRDPRSLEVGERIAEKRDDFVGWDAAGAVEFQRRRVGSSERTALVAARKSP